jgi:hypothetical protein
MTLLFSRHYFQLVEKELLTLKNILKLKVVAVVATKKSSKLLNTYKIPGMSVLLSVSVSVTLQIQKNSAVVYIVLLKVKFMVISRKMYFF